MVIRYVGQAFREQHKIGLRELARGAGVRPAALVQLEHQRFKRVDMSHIDRLCAYFHQRGIACAVGDLLVREPDPPAGEG